MIKPSGNPTTLIKPTAFVTGRSGARVALSSFHVSYTVGEIARASVGMPIEDLWKFNATGPDTILSVKALGETVFTGYLDSSAITLSGDLISASAILVHQARDLDESSLFSPGSHPSSTEDFSIQMAFQSNEASASAADKALNRRDIRFGIRENMGKEVVKYVISVMNHLVSSSTVRNLPANLEPAWGTISEQSPKVIEALNDIAVHGECSMNVSGDVSSLEDAAAAFARNVALGAMGSGKSPWTVLSALMSSFGLTILCLPDGKSLITPDYSGCKPPSENTIEASSIARFGSSSSKSRPPSAVLAIGYGVAAGNEVNPVSFAPVASFTPKVRPSSTSGVYTVGLPGWMVPVSRSSTQSPPPTLPEFLGASWAKQIYYQVANLNRSLSIIMPFSPNVTPGTVYRIFPSTSVRFMSGGSADVSKSFCGYCHSVTHSLTPDSNDISTSMVFRNIFEDTQEDAMIDGAPLFGDQAPFSAPYSE